VLKREVGLVLMLRLCSLRGRVMRVLVRFLYVFLFGRQSNVNNSDYTHRPTDHLRLRTCQRLPISRTGGNQTHIPTHPRAYIQRSRNQCRFDSLTRSYVRISRATRAWSPPPRCPLRNFAKGGIQAWYWFPLSHHASQSGSNQARGEFGAYRKVCGAFGGGICA